MSNSGDLLNDKQARWNDLGNAFTGLLRSGIVHLTTLGGFQRIIRSGEIRPNDGSFPCTFSGSCLAHTKGWVALFDFEGRSLNQILSVMDQLDTVFYGFSRAGILIQLNRSKLAPMLISQLEVNEHSLHVPIVEVWSTEPIPIDLIEKQVLVWPSTRPALCYEVTRNDQRLSKIEKDIDDAILSESESARRRPPKSFAEFVARAYEKTFAAGEHLDLVSPDFLRRLATRIARTYNLASL